MCRKSRRNVEMLLSGNKIFNLYLINYFVAVFYACTENAEFMFKNIRERKSNGHKCLKMKFAGSEKNSNGEKSGKKVKMEQKRKFK